ncbi:LYR motif-containing protein 2 [Teratosphaeria destructans]|uniref:LYR motif-containing protein 2 n=1 Tax=Teratosphaeria destructans TaxID=418781 RepID=A0A9W7SYY2_9PEZI|nr:LYR motif-containing protein 2 [Teratosphaeria destructans]
MRLASGITQRATRSYATISSGNKLGGGKGRPFLTLEHFVQRSRALALWRDIVRVIRKVPPTSSTREELRTFARGEFERHKYIHDLGHIRYLISKGKTEFDSMRPYIEQNSL